MSEPRPVTWRVAPKTTPPVTRRCSKCGAMTRFRSSDKFRVNANKQNLDVWLVYKCEKCDTTWNLTLFSRVKPKQLDPELYYGFEKNDDALAMKYAFDASVMTKNAAVVDWDEAEYDVEGPEVDLGSEPLEIRVAADFPVPVKLDRVLTRMTGLSRTRVKALVERGALSLADGRDFTKARGTGNDVIKYAVLEGASSC